MSAEAFNWTVLLCAWFALFGIGAAALGVYEWHLRRRNRDSDLLPPPSVRCRIYRNAPPKPISRWGSTR